MEYEPDDEDEEDEDEDEDEFDDEDEDGDCTYLLKIAQQAFAEWLHIIDGMLEDAELSFQEFVGNGQRGELPEAGEALARAEDWVHRAREVLQTVLEEGCDDE